MIIDLNHSIEIRIVISLIFIVILGVIQSCSLIQCTYSLIVFFRKFEVIAINVFNLAFFIERARYYNMASPKVPIQDYLCRGFLIFR